MTPLQQVCPSSHPVIRRRSWSHSWIGRSIQLVIALLIFCGMAAPVAAESVSPPRPAMPIRPARPLPLPAGVEKAEKLIQNRPEVRLEAAKQIAGKLLDLDPSDVGIGERKIMNLASYDLGDGKTAWVNLWQASLVYGLGVQPGSLSWMRADPNRLSPFYIHLHFVPGDEQPKVFVVALDGWFHTSAKMEYDAFSIGPRRDDCKSCQANLSPGTSTAYLIVEPAYPTEEVNVDITIRGAAIVSAIDITAIKS